MPIQTLHIERLRNLKSIQLKNLQQFNLFFGENGSGKTSLLESLHLLATGRSFRTHIPKHYIQHQQDNMLIYAELDDAKIGLQKNASGEQVMRVNGETVATQGQLAKLLPVQVIEPQSTEIIDQGAKARRQLLDWLMFHVEPEFYPCWQHYSKALKQRNALLKTPHTQGLAQHIAIWDAILASEGEKIHQLRAKLVAVWQDAIQQELQQLLPHLHFKMDYQAGFSTQLGLATQLSQELPRDMERRTTQHGVHRADLRLKTETGDVENVCSRGQKKLIIMALKLAQVAMLQQIGKPSIVLIDDLSAELDLSAQQRLLARLQQLQSQVFLTTLDQQTINICQQLTVKSCFFQVQQGQITEFSLTN
ncbi:DNA replication/repair protein RecF [Acinetobacter sp. c1-l78]|uniref:DNA replication/repair protein RecF n=1 Tax=Acinetobacter sp. c1-l78 TaxID=3342803 RepID=UPI0035B6F976